jgi:hypothetical protein
MIQHAKMNDTPWVPPAPSSIVPPSGHQFEIRQGNQRATIVEIGGGLREYRVDGQIVSLSYSFSVLTLNE